MYMIKVQRSDATFSNSRMTRGVARVLSGLVLTALILTATMVTNANNGTEGASAPSVYSNLHLLCPAAATHAANNTASTKKAIVGSWIETVTFSGPGAPPPLKSLVTFAADGTTTVADQGNVNTLSGQLFSAGHGSWEAQGGRTFTWTILELISDLSGNQIGTLKVRGRYTVDQSGNAYTGFFYAEARDTSGNLLFSADGTNAGQRIQVEPMP